MRRSPKPKSEDDFLAGAKAEETKTLSPKKPAARKRKPSPPKPLPKIVNEEPSQKARVTQTGAYFAMNLQLTRDLRVDLDEVVEKGYTRMSRQELVRQALRKELDDVMKKGREREALLKKHGLS